MNTTSSVGMQTGQEAVDWHALFLEAQRAREEAKARTQHLNHVLEGLGDGLVVLDSDLRYRYVNALTLQLMERTEEEVLGKSFYDLYPNLQGTSFEEAMQTALREQRQAETDIFYPRNGRWWRTFINPTESGLTVYYRDITHLKQAEEVQERLAAIVESSEDAIIGKTLEGIITDWKPAAERMFGYTAEEVIGKPKTILFPPDRLEEEVEILQRLRQGIRTEHIETIRVRKDGKQIKVSITVSPIKNANGQIAGAATIIRDVTEQRRLEEERRYVMAEAHCLLWHADIKASDHAHRLHWEFHVPDPEAAQRFLPLPVETGDTYIGAWFRGRLLEDRNECDRRGAAAVRAGRSYQQEFRILDANRQVHWLHEDVHVETIEPGKRWRAIAVCIDITDRKRMEQERLRLAAIVESSNDAIIGKDLNGVITDWNPAAERMFGYAAEEVIGKPKTILFPLDRVGEEDALLARLRRGERIDPFESVRVRKGGRSLDVSLTISPIKDSRGHIIGASTIARDITAHKAANREIERLNARLMRAMQETHHRVKNNLQLICAILDMAAMEHADALPISEAKRLNQQVMTLAAIHDILTHTAQFSGEHSDEISSYEVLHRLLTMLQTTGERSQLEYDIQDVRLSVRQATALALIVNELVSNSIKHGGHEARVTYRTLDHAAQLQVEDNGTGFPVPFELHACANTGLTLVENLARHDLAGTLCFENREQGGARVSLTMPLLDPTSSPPD